MKKFLEQNFHRPPPAGAYGAALLLSLMAAYFSHQTASQLSYTWDEAYHLASAYSFYHSGQPLLFDEQPPLSRWFLGLVPWWMDICKGHTLLPSASYYNEVSAYGLQCLHSFSIDPHSLAVWLRMPSTVAWVFTVMLMLWGARLLGCGRGGQILAFMLLLGQPTLWAHTTLATTEAFTLLGWVLAVALYLNWRLHPSTMRWVLAGIGLGIGWAAKFTLWLHIPFGLCVLELSLIFLKRPHPPVVVSYCSRVAGMLAISMLTLWLLCGLSVGSLSETFSFEYLLATTDGVPTRIGKQLRDAILLPMPSIFYGIERLLFLNQQNRLHYFAEVLYQGGNALYFPVMLFLKANLLMIILGVMVLLSAAVGIFKRFSKEVSKTPREGPSWQQTALISAILLMLISLALSRINIGHRHGLHLYLPLILSIAWATERIQLLRVSRNFMLLIILGLLLTVAELYQHRQDFIAYFNPIAASPTDRWAVDSDLDWGQGLVYLKEDLGRLDYQPDRDRLWISYFGLAPLSWCGLEGATIVNEDLLEAALDPDQHRHIIAISVSHLRYFPEFFAWVQRSSCLHSQPSMIYCVIPSH